jgi:hypothetical protein
MTRPIIYILILLNFFSCSVKDHFIESRLKIADKFINCLKSNTPEKILDYTYHNVDDKINDAESREFYVRKAYKFIEKFGVPPKNKWIIKYDPENNFDRLLITIPLFKGYDSAFNLLQAGIIIVFPPQQISNKIYRYEIEAEYKVTPTIAPRQAGPVYKMK